MSKETLQFSKNEQTPCSFRLKFVTAGGNVACFGTFHKINPREFRFFVKKFPISWVNG